LPREEAERGRQLIRDLGLTRQPLPSLDPQAVLAALARDKKRLESGVPFVLLRRLGEAVVREDVPMALVGRVFAEIISG
jgi:3-dehydroquinate synthetase